MTTAARQESMRRSEELSASWDNPVRIRRLGEGDAAALRDTSIQGLDDV